MGKSCSVMVTDRGEKDLSFVLEPSERITVKNAVSVTLKLGSDRAFRLGTDTSARMF